MKISTQIAAALIAVGLVSQAQATDPVVYLTGSSAYRSTVYSALDNNNGPTAGGVFDANSVTSVTYGNSAASHANYMVFHGTIAGTPVYVDCVWSGSEAGIASAADTTLANTAPDGSTIALPGSPAVWLDVTKVTLDGTAYATNPGTALLENNGVAFHGADLAQADTSQDVSWTPAVTGTKTDLKLYGEEGVVTFTWSRNVNTSPDAAYSACSNVTIPQLATLLGAGRLPASYFTGISSQTNEYVYCVGRNLGSGTRMNTLADTTYGVHTAVQQFSIGAGIINPPTGNLTLAYAGNDGYDSGGVLAGALALDGSCQQVDPFNNSHTGWFALGYSSPGDLLSHGVSTNYWVTMDGVMESNASIENGQCWFWGREHLYGKYGISGIADTVGNALFNGVQTTLATSNLGVAPAGHDSAIPFDLMHVTKTTDISFPAPK